MDPVEKLLAIEEIRQLGARRIRCVDEKDWAGFAACHTPDAVSYSYGPEIVGPQAITEQIKSVLGHRTTATHIHAAEIEITSDTTASAIWPTENMHWWVEDDVQHWMHAYGFYRETFEKLDGKWLVKTRSLSRIRADQGVGARQS